MHAPVMDETPDLNAFRFCTKLDQTLLLGKKASNIGQLLEGIRSVPESSIYHHTHRYLQAHHYLTPEPPNDFAYWITNVLNDEILGERISSIDIVQFQSISDLRDRLAAIMDGHIRSGGRVPECPPGEEFHFMASRIFVLQTPYVVHSLKEFRDNLSRVSVGSLYYHMFDAKLRLKSGENDFSRWFRSLGKQALAEEVTRLDPYAYTLEGLRKRLIVLAAKHDKN